ncbi:protein of unknown function [Aminobacter niigataensis]|nr:protein of unknown function [Aminobacter niigataensis]
MQIPQCKRRPVAMLWTGRLAVPDGLPTTGGGNGAGGLTSRHLLSISPHTLGTRFRRGF